MNTVEENMNTYTKRDVEGAKSATKLYTKLLYPQNTDFKWFIKNSQVKSCEVSVRNIDIAQEIWGKGIIALKGETFRGKPNVVASDRINIPKDIANLRNTVFLITDIFFVNRILFFISLSRKLTSQE